MKIFHINNNSEKLTNNILIILSPVFIALGIIKINKMLSVLLLLIGTMIIFFSNKEFLLTNSYKELFKLVIIGPLLIILGYTQNKYTYLKHMICIIGMSIMLYYWKNFFFRSFQLRR